MKSSLIITLTLAWLCLSGATYAQSTKVKAPGTFYAKQMGYSVDKKEVSIGDWQEFYMFIKNKYGLDSANTFLPDTSLIVSHFKLETFHGLKLAEKHKLPIIGVSINQIMAYCSFRSEAVNLKYKTNFQYFLIDTFTYHQLIARKINPKKLEPIGSNIPELLLAADNNQLVVEKNQLMEKKVKGYIFGFRCLAKTK